MTTLWLIPVLPLFGFILNALFGARAGKRFVTWVACSTVGLSMIYTLTIAIDYMLHGHGEVITVTFFDWISVGSFHVPFAFQIDPASYDARYPWQVMAQAVKYGLPRKDAIAAMTSVPARLIGLGSTMGRIQKGCRADLLLLTGDPLDPRSWIDKVMIDGKIVYERSKDEYLKKLLGEKKVLGEKKK